MTEKLDENCEKIFGYLAFNFDKPHYLNKLEIELNESGVSITKPTLIVHLKHLKKKKIIKKKKEGKQKFAISLNYDFLINEDFYKNFHQDLERLVSEKQAFEVLPIQKKAKLASACLYVIESNRLKYDILKTIDPKNTFQYSLSFQFVKNTLELYRIQLVKSCLNSQTDAKVALKIAEELEKYWKEAIVDELEK
jgi:hypothetical protein